MSNVTCKFCILNMLGLMGTSVIDETTAEVTKPIFANSTYKIRTSFNANQVGADGDVGKIKDVGNYQKKFKKRVLWDFGDGTKKEGYYAEHSYEKPGHYKITCTFFDINRRGYQNNYSIYVTVKEVLPTHLSFDNTNDTITCSKIENIARIQAVLSSTITEDLKICAERLDENARETNYKSINNTLFKFMKKYWCFLEDQNQIYYRTDEVSLKNMMPIDYYTPNYDKIYGKFRCKNGEIELLLYQVIPYYQTRAELSYIDVLNPNSDISTEEENIIKVLIKQVYTEEQLPEDVTYIGKRAIVDIFYKSDFVNTVNDLIFFYDIEQLNITGELESSPNYINMIPIETKIQVIENDVGKVKIGLSPDGFIKYLEGENNIQSSDNYCVDVRFKHSLYSNFNMNGYIFPFIPYDGDDINYYVPKDIFVDYVITNFSPNDSSCILNESFEESEDWFKQFSFKLKTHINIIIESEVSLYDRGNVIKVKVPLDRALKNVNDIVIPREKQQREDINRLIDVYMSHPMWEETPNIKEMLYSILNNKNYLNNMLSDSANFLDNTQNVRTCYVSNLISILQMLGEDISLFETTLFEGNNDLKGFTRLLSMNHSELIGHEIESFPNIRVSSAGNDEDVGALVSSEAIIELNENNKIHKINGVDLKTYNGNQLDEDAADECDLIVRDLFSKDTWIVSMYDVGLQEFSIRDYDISWNWKLLLPSEYSKVNDKIKASEIKMQNPARSQSEKNKIQEEINEYKNIKRRIIDTYYSFYTLRRKKGIERIGNFMDETYITEDITNTENWNDNWGVVHEILMKILLTNCDLLEDNIGQKIEIK